MITKNHILISLLCSICFSTHAEENLANPLGFYSVVDDNCKVMDDADLESGAGLESGAVAGLIGTVAVSAVLDLTKATLKAASETKSVPKSTETGASFLKPTAEGGNTQPIANITKNCIRFWYGRMTDTKVDKKIYIINLKDEDEKEKLTKIWATSSLAEVPYIYGEILIRPSYNNSFFLQPVRLFFREAPDELGGSFMKKPQYNLVLSMIDVAQGTTFASMENLSFDNNPKEVVYSSGNMLKAKTSGPYFYNISDTTNKLGAYRIKLVLTATTEGSKFAGALYNALESNSEDILSKTTSK